MLSAILYHNYALFREPFRQTTISEHDVVLDTIRIQDAQGNIIRYLLQQLPVTVELRDGKVITGYLVSRNNSDGAVIELIPNTVAIEDGTRTTINTRDVRTIRGEGLYSISTLGNTIDYGIRWYCPRY